MINFFNSHSELNRFLFVLKDHYTDELIKGSRYVIEVKKVVYKRSIKQNSLYWLWNGFLEYETGQNKDDLHDFFSKKFITPTEKKIFDEVKYRFKTSTLTTIQFNEYLEKIRLFIIEKMDIILPYPEEIDNFKLFQEQIEIYKTQQL